MNKPRILKIYSKFRVRTWDNTTVPEIRLEGKWLEELGFKIGSEIIIREQKNKLIITIEKKYEE
ncbi:type I addiction module toxin, SymE family [Flavobacteriaceae bacterium R38]|nr:type I addiction module toxin, SymE family [Flavobacteriaceae bacterium R38]